MFTNGNTKRLPFRDASFPLRKFAITTMPKKLKFGMVVLLMLEMNDKVEC